MLTSQVIPDCSHIRRDDAQDLAESIVVAIRAAGRNLRVYLGPDGAIGYEWVLPSGAVEEPTMCGFMSIVGTYTEESTALQIREDLMAMERERIS